MDPFPGEGTKGAEGVELNHGYSCPSDFGHHGWRHCKGDNPGARDCSMTNSVTLFSSGVSWSFGEKRKSFGHTIVETGGTQPTDGVNHEIANSPEQCFPGLGSVPGGHGDCLCRLFIMLTCLSQGEKSFECRFLTIPKYWDILEMQASPKACQGIWIMYSLKRSSGMGV